MAVGKKVTLPPETSVGENLVYYKLDGEEAKRKVFFYYKTHKYKTRVMEEFIRMMHEQI